MSQVRLENISKSYGKKTVNHVLTNLNLTINEGECFVLLGPSGCGKSVLLRLMAGFESPDQGRIYIGDDLYADGEKKVLVPPDLRQLGVVFQEYAVWPHMTVFDNIAYPLKIKKLKKPVIAEKVMNIIELLNLTGMESRYPSQLSGGQQQRVALGRALVADPKILLLDEPLNNLDANLREEMRFEIKELQKKLGITVIYVTHDQDIALSIADRVAIMSHEGVPIQIGTPEEVFSDPINAFIFKFLGLSTFLNIEYKDGSFSKNGQLLSIHPAKVPEAKELVMAFRPSDVILSRQGDGVRGKVVRSSFLGSNMDYLIEIEGDNIRVQLNTLKALNEDLLLREGEPCVVNFRSVKLYDKEDIVGGRHKYD